MNIILYGVNIKLKYTIQTTVQEWMFSDYDGFLLLNVSHPLT